MLSKFIFGIGQKRYRNYTLDHKWPSHRHDPHLQKQLEPHYLVAKDHLGFEGPFGAFQIPHWKERVCDLLWIANDLLNDVISIYKNNWPPIVSITTLLRPWRIICAFQVEFSLIKLFFRVPHWIGMTPYWRYTHLQKQLNLQYLAKASKGLRKCWKRQF